MIPLVVSEIAGKVWAKVWKPLAGLALVALVLGGAVFYGYTHGQASRQPEINKLTSDLAVSQAQVNSLAIAAVRQNAENEAAKKRAELAGQYADAAIEHSRQLEAQRVKDKADFAKQLAAAGKLPACGAAKELICAAVPFPY